MSAGTASRCCNFLFFSVFVFVSADPKIITAKSGQDVTLTCRAPNNNITAVHWSRADLRNKNVLLYQDGQFDPDDQHPSFKNRVDLQDRQMKDGDVSLILKNVTINDAARYKCHVLVNETDSWKLVSIINLRVSPDQKIITAESGQDVTLTCRAPNNNIKSVEWSRDDWTSGYVYLYQDGHFVPDHQHPSFKNRVDLQDRQMKDGDVSLILKNVTINDTGTYECRVVQRVGGPMTLISITNLTVVVPPGQTGGDTEDEGKKEEGKKDEVKNEGGKKEEVKKEEGKKDEGKKEEGKKHEVKNEGGKKEEGKKEEGKKHEVKNEGGKKEEGKKEEGKKHEVKNEGGKKEEGKKEEGKKHEVKNEGGKKEEGKKDEGKKEEEKKEEGKKDEGKKEEGKKEEGKKDERKKHEVKTENGRNGEGEKDESIALQVLPLLLVAAVSGFFLI